VVLTLTLRPLALRLRITDKPGGRKQHIGEIPLVGGMAMFIGILVGRWLPCNPRADGRCWSPPRSSSSWASSTTVTNVGVSARLAAQICAALTMMIGGGLYL